MGLEDPMKDNTSYPFCFVVLTISVRNRIMKVF